MRWKRFLTPAESISAPQARAFMRIDIGSQAVAGVIGHGQDVVIVPVGSDGGDRPEGPR